MKIEKSRMKENVKENNKKKLKSNILFLSVKSKSFHRFILLQCKN